MWACGNERWRGVPLYEWSVENRGARGVGRDLRVEERWGDSGLFGREGVEGAFCACVFVAEHVQVDLRGAEVFVAEQVLDRTDVGSLFQKVGGKRVSQRMAACGLRNLRGSNSPFDGLLDR